MFCSAYQDRIFLIVSQFEKIGTLVSVVVLSVCYFFSLIAVSDDWMIE